MSTISVLQEVGNERIAQDEKWGAIQSIPFGTGWNLDRAAILEDARDQNDGPGATFASVLVEEVYEALVEDDPVKLRAELVQVAAVAAKFIEHIDRKERVNG